MIRKMVNGPPSPFPTLNTRAHGSKRKSYKGKWGRLLSLITLRMIHISMHIIHWNTLLLSYGRLKSGTLFDNILTCDDPEYALKLAEETWGKTKNAAFEEAEKKKEEQEDGDAKTSKESKDTHKITQTRTSMRNSKPEIQDVPSRVVFHFT